MSAFAGMKSLNIFKQTSVHFSTTSLATKLDTNIQDCLATFVSIKPVDILMRDHCFQMAFHHVS